MRSFLSFLLLLWLGIAQALSNSGNRLLVVLEDMGEKDNYSLFFGDLESRGFKVFFESPKNDKLALFELGERAYDHLLILPSRSKGLGPNLTPANLLKFINAKGNILLTLSANNPTPSAISSLLLEFDIHLPSERNALVVDHFNYDVNSAKETHDVIVVPRPDHIRQDVRSFFHGEGRGREVIAFPRGIGQVLGNDSPLLAPILRAPRSAYSYNPKEEKEGVEDPFAVGEQLSLVSVMQARNSARFTVLGAAEMLEDKWFGAKVKRGKGLQTTPIVEGAHGAHGGANPHGANPHGANPHGADPHFNPHAASSDGGNPHYAMMDSGTDERATLNREFAKEVAGWTFNEIGVLKVFNIEHYLDENNGIKPNETNPKIYRVKNDVKYTIEVGEWSWDKYVPFHAMSPIDDLQLEFSMLSPFHRINLAPSPIDIKNRPNSTLFSAAFKLPDQHGIFNFKINHKRPFLSNIEEKNTVSVRHFAHDEYPRSWVISNTWPWIGGIAVTVVGWVAFVGIWLWSAPVNGAAAGKKTQ